MYIFAISKQALYRFFGGVSLCIGLMIQPVGFVFAEELADSFAGICTGENVNIRVGANLNFEILAKINKNDKVIVLGRESDWYKIKISPDTGCFIHKDQLGTKDNKTVVKGSRVNVRSGAGMNYPILGQLQENTVVAARAQEGDWVQVVPPEGFFAWVNSRYIKFYKTLAEFQVEQQLEIQRQDVFKKIEESYNEQLSRPVLEADFSLVAEGYQKFLGEYPHSPEALTIKERLEFLKLKTAEKEYALRSQTLEKKLKEVEEQQRQEILPPPTAVGHIEDLGRIINRPGTHKLLSDGRLAYYLRSNKCDLNKYIYHSGVRIWGKVVEQPNWDKPVIEVEIVRPE